MLAGLVKAPTAYDPAGRDKTAALDRRNYVIDRMTELEYLSPARGRRRSRQTPIQLKLTDPPNDCVSVNPAHNDWGFFCDMFKNWWRNQPAFGETPAGAGGEPAPRRLHDRHLARSADAGDRDERGDQPRRRIGSSYALGLVAIEPGTGQIKAAAVNRSYSLDQSHNGRHHATTRRPSRACRAATRTRSRRCSAAATCPATRPARRSRSSRWSAALEQGLPLNTPINSPLTVQTQYLAGVATRLSCGGLLVPAQRQRGDDRRADHVDRLRQVGQHLLRPAGGAGRRGERGRDGRAARPDLAHRRRPAAWPRRRTPTAGARSPSASPTRRRWRWPTRTPRSPPTGCYCEAVAGACASPTRPASRSPAGEPQLPPGRHGPRSARAAVDATRCVTGYKAATGVVRRLVHRARRLRRGRPPGRRQDRHHRRHPGGLVRRHHARAWPRRASSPTRTIRSTSPATGTRRSRSTRSPALLRRGLAGTPVRELHPAHGGRRRSTVGALGSRSLPTARRAE